MVAEKVEFLPSLVEISGEIDPGIDEAKGKLVILFSESNHVGEPALTEVSPEQQVLTSMTLTIERGYKLAAQQLADGYLKAGNNLSTQINTAQAKLDHSLGNVDFILAEFHFRNAALNGDKV